MVHAFDPSTQGTQAGNSEFEAILVFITSTIPIMAMEKAVNRRYGIE